MPIVEIDKAGRMTIPREIGITNSKAIVIPAGSFFITIPLAINPIKDASDWLPAESNQNPAEVAEELAREDAVNRAKRRLQL